MYLDVVDHVIDESCFCEYRRFKSYVAGVFDSIEAAETRMQELDCDGLFERERRVHLVKVPSEQDPEQFGALVTRFHEIYME